MWIGPMTISGTIMGLRLGDLAQPLVEPLFAVVRFKVAGGFPEFLNLGLRFRSHVIRSVQLCCVYRRGR